MGDIQVGKIVIQDFNQNDLFDAGIDRVVDASGQPLTPAQEAKELRSITQELGVKRFGGILLSEASTFINDFQEADTAAQNGDVSMVELHLQSAQQAAKNLNISTQQARADAILETALHGGVQANFQSADSSSQKGEDIDVIKTLLQDAEAYTLRLQTQFRFTGTFDRQKADQILKNAYQNGIPRLEQRVLTGAQTGDIAGTLSDLKDLKRLIPEANQKYQFNFKFDSAQAKKSLNAAFLNGVPRAFQESNQLALRGQAIRVRARLTQLEKRTQDANAEFQTNLKFDQKTADQILETALFYGIPDNFKLATSAAKAGSIRSTDKWLKLARSYVDEYNQKFADPRKNKPKLVFDQPQANTLVTCANRQGPCP